MKTLFVAPNATFTWESGTILLRDPANNDAPGVFTNRGRVVTVSSSTRTLRGLLINDGVLEHPGGWNWIYFSNATLRNLADRTLLLSGGDLGIASGSNTHLLENWGTVRKVGNNASYIYVPLQNAGLIDHREGSLSISRLVQTDGETRIHRGRTLSVSNPMAMQGGKLTGAGTLSGHLNQTGGAIAPGIDDPDNPDLNPLGILTLNGNLTMGQDATLEIELAGTDNSDPNNPQYDQVIISGYNRTVQLDGTLRLKGRDGYTPSVGDVYAILVRTASSWNRTGQFHTVEVDPDTLPCVQVEVRYLADRVQVAVVSVGGNADVDRNGCVDDSDLLAVLFA
ncbi:MAG: hypothetical protein ACK4UU_09060, partial [Fimbriimonadales bacterium]